MGLTYIGCRNIDLKQYKGTSKGHSWTFKGKMLSYVKKQKECFSNINSSTPYDSCLCLSNSNFKLAKRNAYEWQICCPKFISKMTSRSRQTEKNFGFMDSCLADFIAVVECVTNNCDKFNCTTIYYFAIILQLIWCKNNILFYN